jgi:hypothetical protein
MPATVTTQQWEEIDRHLSQKEVLMAVQLYRMASGSSLRDAKDAIGVRFRERFPELWANFDQGLDDGNADER